MSKRISLRHVWVVTILFVTLNFGSYAMDWRSGMEAFRVTALLIGMSMAISMLPRQRF